MGVICVFREKTATDSAYITHVLGLSSAGSRNDYHITSDNVPAWVCTQCGERYFEEQQVEEIEEAIKRMDVHAAQLHRAA